jgi:rare lipoprotein A
MICGAALLCCIAAPRYTHSAFDDDTAASHKSSPHRSSAGTVRPRAEATGNFSKVGEASYYANKFNGRRTASGERYDRRKFTGAHRTLPFGTMVKVTNLKNNRSVTIRINDRGPQKKSRIIDLSAAAAREIGMIADGVVKVGIEIVGNE